MPDLLSSEADGVLTLTFNRPASFNAMTDEMSDGFASAMESCAGRDDVRVVVVTGAGDAFNAGADISGADAHERFDVRALDRANRMVRAVVSCSRACRIFWEKLHWSQAGSLAMSMTASPNAVIRSLVNRGMSSPVRC